MRETEPKFELIDIARVPAGDWIVGDAAGFEIVRTGGIWRIARKHNNSGNEAKKYLKTKEITFLKAATYARFVHRLRAI
jgi:hypothetical protein